MCLHSVSIEKHRQRVRIIQTPLNDSQSKNKRADYTPHAVVVHMPLASPLACKDYFEDHLVMNQLLKQFLWRADPFKLRSDAAKSKERVHFKQLLGKGY